VADDDPNLLPLVTGNGRTLATADITALIGLINGMLGSMEARIIERLAENSRGAETRWEAHDRASERTIAAIREEIGVVRSELVTLSRAVADHHTKEHDQELVLQARVRPIVSTTRWLVTNWPKALALMFGILGFFALLFDLFERYTGFGAGS